MALNGPCFKLCQHWKNKGIENDNVYNYAAKSGFGSHLVQAPFIAIQYKLKYLTCVIYDFNGQNSNFPTIGLYVLIFFYFIRILKINFIIFCNDWNKLYFFFIFLNYKISIIFFLYIFLWSILSQVIKGRTQKR